MGAINRGFQIGFLTVVLSVFLASTGEAKSCSDLGEDLRAMKRAQASLLDSMVRKNESMASTLEQYAKTLAIKKNLRKSDLVGMKKSAQAFRQHREREEKLVSRFENKTDELIALVEDCLKSKAIAAQ